MRTSHGNKGNGSVMKKISKYDLNEILDEIWSSSDALSFFVEHYREGVRERILDDVRPYSYGLLENEDCLKLILKTFPEEVAIFLKENGDRILDDIFRILNNQERDEYRWDRGLEHHHYALAVRMLFDKHSAILATHLNDELLDLAVRSSAAARLLVKYYKEKMLDIIIRRGNDNEAMDTLILRADPLLYIAAKCPQVMKQLKKELARFKDIEEVGDDKNYTVC